MGTLHPSRSYGDVCSGFVGKLEPAAWELERTSPACRNISAHIAWQLRTHPHHDKSFRNIHNHRRTAPMLIIGPLVDGCVCFLKRVEASLFYHIELCLLNLCERVGINFHIAIIVNQVVELTRKINASSRTIIGFCAMSD